MKKIVYITKKCEFCKKEFSVKQTCKRNAKKIFCSRACSSTFNGLKNRGNKCSEERKQKLREKNSGSGNPFHGKKHSDETKLRIALKNKGKKSSEDKKRKLSKLFSGEGNPFYGKKHTYESRAKISENHPDHSGEKNPNFANGEKIKGDRNPNWQGGISYGDYGKEFTEELKTAIRKRDGFKCKICDKNGYDVHHIDYNKKNNLQENLINLCRSCHAKTNFNRESWMAFFNTMKEKING